MVHSDGCGVCFVAKIPEVAVDVAVWIRAARSIKVNRHAREHGCCILGERDNRRPVKHSDGFRSHAACPFIVGHVECYRVVSVVGVGVGCDITGASVVVAKIPSVADNCSIWIIAGCSVEGHGFASVWSLGLPGEVGHRRLGWNRKFNVGVVLINGLGNQFYGIIHLKFHFASGTNIVS